MPSVNDQVLFFALGPLTDNWTQQSQEVRRLRTEVIGIQYVSIQRHRWEFIIPYVWPGKRGSAVERLERKRGAPSQTYPDPQESIAEAAPYTCLPPWVGPKSHESGGHFTWEKQEVGEKKTNKKSKQEEGARGKSPNLWAVVFFTTVVSQTFFITMVGIVYIILPPKKACSFFLLTFLFLKKKKEEQKNHNYSTFKKPKKGLTDMENMTFRKPQYSMMNAITLCKCVCI